MSEQLVFRFPYRSMRLPLSDGGVGYDVFRPLFEVEIGGPKGNARLLALVDTGADETIVPESVRELLGVEVAETTLAQ